MAKNTVVVIEDNPEIRDTIKDLLESSDYNVHTAADGIEGLNLIRSESPDVVLCDIMMPKMNGHEMVKQLRADVNLRHTPVIFVTAKVALDEKLEGLELGANDYITKPFELQELLLKIKNTVSLRDATLNFVRSKPQEVEVLSKDERLIIQLNSIIESRIKETGLGLNDLAADLKISTSSLQKKLRKISDKSVSQYLREYRLDRAKNLLDSNFGTLKEITAECGFKNVSYFSRSYKAYFGHSPKRGL